MYNGNQYSGARVDQFRSDTSIKDIRSKQMDRELSFMIKESDLINSELSMLLDHFKILCERKYLLSTKFDSFEKRMREEILDSQQLNQRLKKYHPNLKGRNPNIVVSTLSGNYITIEIKQIDFYEFLQQVAKKFKGINHEIQVTEKTCLVIKGEKYTREHKKITREMVENAIQEGKIHILNQVN
jgi:hypothetical protein